MKIGEIIFSKSSTTRRTIQKVVLFIVSVWKVHINIASAQFMYLLFVMSIVVCNLNEAFKPSAKTCSEQKSFQNIQEFESNE